MKRYEFVHHIIQEMVEFDRHYRARERILPYDVPNERTLEGWMGELVDFIGKEEKV